MAYDEYCNTSLLGTGGAYVLLPISGGSEVSSKKGFMIKEIVREGSWVATTFGESTSLRDQSVQI